MLANAGLVTFVLLTRSMWIRPIYKLGTCYSNNKPSTSWCDIVPVTQTSLAIQQQQSYSAIYSDNECFMPPYAFYFTYANYMKLHLIILNHHLYCYITCAQQRGSTSSRTLQTCFKAINVFEHFKREMWLTEDNFYRIIIALNIESYQNIDN